MSVFLRRRIFVVLFLFLFSSCSKPCHYWQQDTASACTPPVPITKIYSTPNTPFNGIMAEFVCCGAQQDFYLNILTLQFPALKDNHTITPVTITVEGQQYTYDADRMEGGQRTHLPDEARDLIINSLMAEESVQISSGRYHETLITDNFPLLYQKATK